MTGFGGKKLKIKTSTPSIILRKYDNSPCNGLLIFDSMTYCLPKQAGSSMVIGHEYV